MSVRLDYTLRDEPITRRLRALAALGADPQPILEAIAFHGEQSTRERFATETDPQGHRWKPSLRRQAKGGKTLTASGQLAGSISSHASGSVAQWGTNKIYGAIHQFGGTIRAKSGGRLTFRVPGGGFVSVKSVTIPARPYLGVSDEDEAAFQDIVIAKIAAAAERGA